MEVVCLLLPFWNSGKSGQQPTEGRFHLGQNCDENLQVHHWCGLVFLSVCIFFLFLFHSLIVFLWSSFLLGIILYWVVCLALAGGRASRSRLGLIEKSISGGRVSASASRCGLR